MTHRERMEAFFKGGRLDRMGWFGDLTYWHSAHETIGDIPERWRGTDGRHRMHVDLGVGEYIPGGEPWNCIEGEKVETLLEERDGARTSIIRTPLGELKERWEYSPISFSWGCVEHAVKTIDDLRPLRYVFDARSYLPKPERLAALDKSYSEYEMGPAHAGCPATPLGELNKHWIGVMDLCFMMADAPDELDATLKSIAMAHDKVYRIVADNPDCEYIMVCENLSAETMGGYFETYLAPHLRRWSSWLHEKGKHVMLHNDGTLRGTIEKLAGAGIDCVDAVTPAPVGDMDLDEARRLAGDKILILGGLPGAMFTTPFTRKEMTRHVMGIIERHKDAGNFMFGVADQIPPNADLDLVRLVGDLIAEHGLY